MTGSPPARRLLGAALRQYRENLGLMLEDAARVLECDRSKISRVETGQRGIRPKELRELLTEYGVSEQEQSALAIIAQPGRRGGWQQYGEVIPGPFRDYLALEQAASDIFAYDPQHVPDLLQTPDYAQAGVTADPSLPAGTLAGLTLLRQQALGQRGARLTALIGEAALRQGNGTSKVTRDQLRALADASGPMVVQVLPSRCGAPASGPATILRFAGAPSLGIVYLPGPGGGVCLAGQHDVASYTRAFEHLRALALTPAGSARLLREIAAAGRV
jgi:transcriptional regulator with XRE-family HTH domain